MADRAVEPFAVAQMVETYVDSELRDAAKYTNREPLDDSGVYGLHDLAARIYALGFNEGEVVEGHRARERRIRAQEQESQVSEPVVPE